MGELSVCVSTTHLKLSTGGTAVGISEGGAGGSVGIAMGTGTIGGGPAAAASEI